MLIFKYNIQFRSWGEIYMGLTAQWIYAEQALSFYEENHIVNYTADRYVALYLALEDSLDSFCGKLKQFIKEDGDPPIEEAEILSQDIYQAPPMYWRIWRIEFLLQIESLDLSKEEKLSEIATLFDRVGYPVEWHPFLYYQSNDKGDFLTTEELYSNFEKYLSREIVGYRNQS